MVPYYGSLLSFRGSEVWPLRVFAGYKGKYFWVPQFRGPHSRTIELP